MGYKTVRTFVGDFETTVYDDQDYTEVWASASVELYTDDVQIFHTIDEQFQYFVSQKCNIVCYYHNLKFDGTFWLSYLLSKLEYTQACIYLNDEHTKAKWVADKDMPSKSVKYSISDMGQWYYIRVKIGEHTIEFRDSLKLLPFSVKKIGESFKTKHKKLDMEYKGFRYAGCEITAEEKEYIANDVLVVKEALEIMFNEGHKSLTIGSCCLQEYRKIVSHETYKHLFPNIYEHEIDAEQYGRPNAGEYVRNSYKGGWCYLVKGKENQMKYNGTTADVNSLYPSMMSSESGNRYPVGSPTFWKGDYIPDEAWLPTNYFFVRIKTRFYLKRGYLPFIQIKNSLLYKSTECLMTSDVYNKSTGKYCRYWKDIDGNKHDSCVTLTLTMTDYLLLHDHYRLEDFEVLDGCYFKAMVGIFDEYIDKYKKIKLESTGALRELAKLFLNNLYGKMASNTDSSFKLAHIKEDGSLGYMLVEEHDKKPGYIPIGSAITSYARNFTIRAAQMNYYGVSKRGFIYADTDSIHCDLSPEEIKGITVHDKNFCCWKLESSWDKAIFVRQKTYIEHIIGENQKPIKEPYYSVKCAGMPQQCKDYLVNNFNGYKPTEKEAKELPEEVIEFYKMPRTMLDYKIGLKVPGKLRPVQIKGGTLLVEGYYEMRGA